MIVQNISQIGIIFAGERSEIALSMSQELIKLGYRLSQSDIVSEEFLSSLNEWRRGHSLPELDFVDPVSLRLLLGADVGGDELVLLAGCAETLPTEVERYQLCREAISGSKAMMVSLTQYLSGRFELGATPDPSADSMKCAVIAKLIT